MARIDASWEVFSSTVNRLIDPHHGSTLPRREVFISEKLCCHNPHVRILTLSRGIVVSSKRCTLSSDENMVSTPGTHIPKQDQEPCVHPTDPVLDTNAPAFQKRSTRYRIRAMMCLISAI